MTVYSLHIVLNAMHQMQIHLNFEVLTSQTEENKHTNEVIEVSVKKVMDKKQMFIISKFHKYFVWMNPVFMS